MSLEKSYIRNLTLKYRLAVAIAVIKDKPEYVSIEEYIEELRNKVNNDSEDDLDLTICSDDFDLNDNDDITNDRAANDIASTGNDRANNDITMNAYLCDSHFNDIGKVTRNDKGSSEINSNERTTNNVTLKQASTSYDSQNSETILKDLNKTVMFKVRSNGHPKYNDNTVNDNDRSKNEEFRSIPTVANSVKDKIKGIETNTSYNQDSETILRNVNSELLFHEEGHNTNLDFVNINANSIVEELDYASQINLSRKSNTPDSINIQSTYCETQVNVNNNTFSNLNEIGNVIKESSLLVNEVAANEVHINESCSKNIPDTFYDSQATQIYSVHGFSQNYTHVSQSQYYDEIVTNDKFIRTKNNKINSSKSAMAAENYQNITIVDISESNNKVTEDLAFDLSRNNKENHLSENLIENLNVDSNIHLNQNLNDFGESNEVTTIVNQNSMEISESFPQYGQDLNRIPIYEDIISTQLNEVNESQVIELAEHDESLNNDTEIVSFKVVEELNKVKNYINRRVERRLSNDGSMDSGYKSDSQKSSYRNSLQLSGNWLNQSAHSLYNYIMQCPLLATTQEIVNEIAQVLGQLIDKLHEEERYPSFLEELLENVEFLLHEIFEGHGGEDVLLKKDENIQRLFLLNKSPHIQKYTIEKIASLLENIHTHLSNPDDTYEITNITQMENLSYIFHILEVILPKYGKNKITPSEDNSPNELKKSSLTNIWKKKWNPNYKDVEMLEESAPKKCVLLRCNEVLNKLVVCCMDGYSLVAFSALQCFNMLQS